MSIQAQFRLRVLTAVALAAIGAAASAAPVTHYSYAYINSNESVYDAPPDRVRDQSGAAVQAQSSGSRVWAFSNGTGYFFNTETSSVFARSELNTGALKASSSLGLGSITGGTPPAAEYRYTSASATAEFADQFRLYSGSTPYLWSDSTEVSFSLGITGRTDIPSTIPTPTSFSSTTWAHLGLYVYKIGTLDLIQQMSQIDVYPNNEFDQAAWDAILALNEQIGANRLHYSGWCLGDNRLPSGSLCGGPGGDPIVALDGGGVTIEHSFLPGEDFEWILTLETRVMIDTSLQNVSASIDFGNTIQTGFIAPSGATVYSASGLFPNTLPLDGVASAVPEPESLALCLSGILLLVIQRRSRRRCIGATPC